MRSFAKRYLARVAVTLSILCVGLDLTPDHVPPQLGTGLEAMRAYLRALIDAAAKRAPVVKFQYAYYAALGPEYILLMVEMIDYAHSLGLEVILDAKRADIDRTMAAYGDEVFGQYHVDACTFVPYLGGTFLPSKASKVWLPWLEQGRAVISMIRTSNPDAAAFQDLKLDNGRLIYEQMAVMVSEWNAKVAELTNGAGCVGGVVGATWPEQAPKCRQLAGDDVFFLIPGYGAQGGGSDGAVAGLPNSQGLLMGTVNSSSGITRDSWFDKDKKEPKPGDSLELVVAAIDAANADLNGALGRKLGKGASEIFACGCTTCAEAKA